MKGAGGGVRQKRQGSRKRKNKREKKGDCRMSVRY